MTRRARVDYRDHLYRSGIRIVLSALLLAGVVCLAAVNREGPPAPRAAHDLGPSYPDLGTFRLEERSGRTVTEGDLADRVGIASFIFTRCPLSCPRISGVMKGLQDRLAGTNVLLVSISVDPEHDTPAVLSEYAKRFGARPDRWWFLTGPKATIYGLIRDRLKLSLVEGMPADPETGTEAIVHSDRLALAGPRKGRGILRLERPAGRRLADRQGSSPCPCRSGSAFSRPSMPPSMA